MRKWWKYYNERGIDRDIRDGIEEDYDLFKVIFLDIDGVLNPENYREHDRVDEDKVQLLAQIVEATGAKIIMSSSWRRFYEDFAKKDFKMEEQPEWYISDAEHNIMLLHNLLSKYGLSVDGVTPLFGSGQESRPAQIAAWLAAHRSVINFVILDDDRFWRWGWLGRYLVNTITDDPNSETPWDPVRRGLTQAHADMAIAILNEEVPNNSIDKEQCLKCQKSRLEHNAKEEERLAKEKAEEEQKNDNE